MPLIDLSVIGGLARDREGVGGVDETGDRVEVVAGGEEVPEADEGDETGPPTFLFSMNDGLCASLMAIFM